MPGFWATDYYVLLSLSLALSVLAFLLRARKRKAVLLIILRATILSILSVPSEPFELDVFLLVSTMVVESIMFVPGRAGIAMSVALAGWLIAIPKPVRSLEVLNDPPAIAVMVCYLFGLLSIGFVVDLLGRLLSQTNLQKSIIGRLDSTITKLASANLGFQQYVSFIRDKSTAEERKRITRQVHDTVGYTLVNIKIMLEEAIMLSEKVDGALGEILQRARDQAQNGLNETRRAMRVWRHVENGGFEDLRKIRTICDAFEQVTGIRVRTEFSNTPNRLSAKVFEVIYHMMQEGFVNAFRHGQADRIDVYFWKNDAELIVTIQDNGTGAATLQEGIGLCGMRERVTSVGGHLAVRSDVDGFEVRATIPYESS